MTIHLKISHENAETIGGPIFDKIIHSFTKNDRDDFIQQFPYLEEWMTAEIFDEAVEVLNRLGAVISSEYSAHSIEKSNHLLTWKVQYKNDKNKVVWDLFLDDKQEDIKVSGFRFDR